MNGAHDMGGMQCMGPIFKDGVREKNEPIFHGEWERRVLGLALAMGAMGRWNLDMSRFARENTAAVDYLGRSYYQTWLYGLEKLLVEKELIHEDEIEAALGGAHAERITEPVLTADRVGPALAKGSTARMDEDRPDKKRRPKFLAGQPVRVLNRNPRGHTRVPRYVRGRVGEIATDHGVFIFPDTHAADGTKNPQHVYSVRFTAPELWGEDAPAKDQVYVDLWDDYLEPAP